LRERVRTVPIIMMTMIIHRNVSIHSRRWDRPSIRAPWTIIDAVSHCQSADKASEET
jgi:hypothetical protein